MLATTDPAPTGLITALLGRARALPSAITATIGPSPRQMKELTEGRGLFSPFKLGRVAELTGIPEIAIREAMDRVPEMIEAISLEVGGVAEHPRLGRCEVLKAGPHLTIRTEKGVLIEDVHPVCFAGPDLLDRFGLTPEPDPSGAVIRTPGGPEIEPALKADTNASDPGPESEKTVPKSVVKDNLTAPAQPDAEPATETEEEASSRADATAHQDPRARVRDLVARSGRSQASLSRALGKDPSFLHGIIKRGRGVPEDLLCRLTRILTDDEGAERAPAPRPEPTVPAAPEDPAQKRSEAPHVAEPEDLVDETAEEAAAGEPAPENPRQEGRIFVLQPSPPGPEAEMMEVVIDGVCRVRVPAGFDMEAAARLIRSVSSGIPAMSAGR
mgnify:CR=1 FL=1